VASYFHRHYDGLLRYYQLEAGGLGKKESRDVFLVRGYVKTEMYLTASLSEVTARTLEGFQNSRWPLPSEDEEPTDEEMYRSHGLMRFDFSPLNVDLKKPLFSGLYLAGPSRVMYHRKYRRRPTGEPPNEPDYSEERGDDEIPVEGHTGTSSVHDPEKGGSQSFVGFPKGTYPALQGEGDTSQSQSEPTTPTPFSVRLRKSLEDPHDQCVAIYPLRYRPRSWIPKMFAQAEPQDPDYHRDDSTGPAVASEDGAASDQEDEDPLHHLLNYILKYSAADAAVADIEDIAFASQVHSSPDNIMHHLFVKGHEAVQGFRAFLEKTRPRIYVSDENVGTLYMDCYLPDQDSTVLSARTESDSPEDLSSPWVLQRTTDGSPAATLLQSRSDPQRVHPRAITRHSIMSKCSDFGISALPSSHDFTTPLSTVRAF